MGALALSTGLLLERIALKKKKIDVKLYQTTSFLAIFLITLLIVYFFWDVKPEATQTKNLIVFTLVILFSMIANFLAFYSLKWEKISNLEPAKMLEPLFVILLAVIFSFFFIESDLYERNTKILIPALIAGAALVFSHIKKHHLEFNKYFIAAILGSFFFALELVVSRIILEFYSPISFYFLRCAILFFTSLFIFSPNFKKLDKKSTKLIFLTAAILVIYRIIVYYGYIYLGVIFTTLIIMLGPVFVYLFAWKFLKEKPTWKNIATAIIIILCILYALVF